MMEGLVSSTWCITLFLSDGSLVRHDLSDPRIPLPRFRALTGTRTDRPRPAQQSRSR
jgi:hypothetical protein